MRAGYEKNRALYDIKTEDVDLNEGIIIEIVDAVEGQIVVRIPDGEYYAMSSDTLETAFEIAEN